MVKMLIPSTIYFPIEILLNTIINNYLQTSFCLTFVTETELMINLPLNMSSMRIIPNNSELVQQILETSEKACTDYIIQMDEPRNFMIAFDKVNHVGDVRKSDKKLIFLPLEDEFYNPSVLTDLLSLKETGYVPNILLITPTGQKSSDCKVYDMITHTFVGAEEQIQNPLYLDRWDCCTEVFEKEVNLFPHDMSNLYGKKVKVGAFTYKPYVLLDLEPSLAPLGRDGIDIRFIEEFCRWINCTVEIVRPDDGQEWGEIYENNTGIGLVGNLVEDRTEIGITSLYSWYEEYRALDFSAPIIRTAVTCIAPAPRILSSWDLPLVPFSWLMWMCLIATFFFASFALFVAQRSTDDIFFVTFGNMIGQSPGDSSSWRIRSISGWMLVTGLVIDNAYSGGLASSFTVPKYEASVDTIQDLVDRKMEWGAPVDAWLYSMILSEEPLIKSAISQFKVYPPETLTKKSFTRSMAFSIERLPAGSFAIGEYITKEGAKNLELMVEDMYYEQCVVMTRKSSPYTAKLTELVGRLQQSGLLLCWETQIALKYLDFKVQLEVRLSRTKKDIDGVEPLNVKQLLGIYLLYFGGLSISIVVFIAELLIKRGKAVIVI
uniref:Putative ionotropic receptor IR41a.2 n=1 Tax=Cydia pomonella TaxID=82600 RepID=A0A0V0J120_CYDPO